MGLVDLLQSLEKLINEHGSAAILKERLELLKAQLAADEGKRRDLEAQAETARAQEQAAQAKIGELEQQLAALRAKHFCDHCGSANVRRTGARDNPMMGAVGIKDALFTCAECGKVSAFMLAP